MKFVSFEHPATRAVRFGLVLDDGAIADLQAAYGVMRAVQGGAQPSDDMNAGALHDALAFITMGDAGLALAQQVADFLRAVRSGGSSVSAPDGAPIVFSQSEVALRAPIPQPRKFIAAGKNFRDHMAEMSGTIPIPRRPVAFAQMSTTIVGPNTAVPHPPETKALDYEVEVAVVIGKPAVRVSADAALDHVFGYTIFNDISARDVYREEGRTGIPLLGKNFPGFAPLGPVLVTRDEIGSLPDVRLQLRVNGETRQDATLSSMLFNVEQLVAHWSQIGLEPGDIITTGTPSGVAAGRKADETPWWLKAGDIVEAEVAGIGVLRNIIVAGPDAA